jgi:hypothetical protein
VPVPLPDGRVVWLFGDTYIGTVYADGSILPNDHLVNNSFVVQSGRCFTPLMGGAQRARTDLIPDPAPNQWYWPASGVVSGNALFVFMWRIENDGGALGFHVLDMRMAVFSLPNLTLQSIGPAPIPASPDRPYGAAGFGDATSGYLYLYGANSVGPSDGVDEPEQRNFVARAPLDAFTFPETWTYWDGVGWSASSAAAIPMTFAGTPGFAFPPSTYPIDGPAAPLTVSPAPADAVGYSYLGTAKLLDALSADVSVFTAPTPNGPWTYKAKVADTVFPGLSTYGAATHLSLPGATSPIVVFSTNDSPFDSGSIPPSIQSYGPRFVAPLPGSLP